MRPVDCKFLGDNHIVSPAIVFPKIANTIYLQMLMDLVSTQRWILIITTLLRCNLHIIKFTIFKCTIQWSLVNLLNCANIQHDQLAFLTVKFQYQIGDYSAKYPQTTGRCELQKYCNFTTLNLWPCLFERTQLTSTFKGPGSSRTWGTLGQPLAQTFSSLFPLF